jgi:excinuclease ABC subunit A
MVEKTCDVCKSKRLKREALHFKIAGKNISDLSQMDIQELADWFHKIENKLSEKQLFIAKEIIKELRTRIQFLLDVGLNYLNLDRSSKSLSGGEAQRIRLATQIGSQLVGVLYILDEPSIGLHQRDNQKLIDSLVKLRDVGNSVIVVEHDKDMIQHADFVLDIGPGAGIHGGEIVSKGNYKELLTHKTLTADYLNGKRKIEIPTERR